MYTENGLLVDIGEIRGVIRDADVFTAAFRLFPERLVIDTRFDAADPGGPSALPMVAIVDPVASVQERFFWLGQHRPSLGMPKNFEFFYWPHSISYLDESGIWDAIRERVTADGFAGASDTCDAALADLLVRERQTHLSAIGGGESWSTLWSVRDA